MTTPDEPKQPPLGIVGPDLQGQANGQKPASSPPAGDTPPTSGATGAAPALAPIPAAVGPILAAPVGPVPAASAKAAGGAPQNPQAPQTVHGCFHIWPADKDGNPIRWSPDAQPKIDDPDAVEIYFGVAKTAPGPIPQDQFQLQQDIEKVLRAVQQLYLRPTETPGGGKRFSPPELTEKYRLSQFRIYYARLFRLAQVGLEGDNVSPEIARGALTQVTADLIDDEAGRVKNGHLTRLGLAALKMSMVALVIYLAMRLTPPGSWVDNNVLKSIGIMRLTLANFMLLWVGCFIGVWLSYGIRTQTFTLADLTVTDTDRMLPFMRMLFAGTLTMLLGILFFLDAVKISIGNYQITDFTGNPSLAFLIGAFCGISELMLPATIAKQATDFIGKVK